MTSKFGGREGFIWWWGRVEDRNDPLQIGRLRVRIMNFHTQDHNLLPTTELIWAYPIQPIYSAATYPPNAGTTIAGGPQTPLSIDPTNTPQVATNGGIGISPTGVLDGSIVFGFYADASDSQIPMVLGTFASYSPTTTNPTLQNSENDISLLARGTNSIVDNLFCNEPPSSYAAEYPYNKTVTTESGHAIELDDTPGAERIRMYHEAGTYFEISPEGRLVTKVTADKINSVVQNKNECIGQDWTVDVHQNSDLDTTQDCLIYGHTSLTLQSDVQVTIRAPLVNIISTITNINGQAFIVLQGGLILENPSPVGGGQGGVTEGTGTANTVPGVQTATENGVTYTVGQTVTIGSVVYTVVGITPTGSNQADATFTYTYTAVETGAATIPGGSTTFSTTVAPGQTNQLAIVGGAAVLTAIHQSGATPIY